MICSNCKGSGKETRNVTHMSAKGKRKIRVTSKCYMCSGMGEMTEGQLANYNAQQERIDTEEVVESMSALFNSPPISPLKFRM